MSTLAQYNIKTETEYKEKPTHIKAHDKKHSLNCIYGILYAMDLNICSAKTGDIMTESAL